jgi:hypothetical protein
VHAAIAAVMVVGPDIVAEKMYAWMQSEGSSTQNDRLSKEIGQVTVGW